MAYLFLYYYEHKYARKVRKFDLDRARQLANVFRLIDDLTGINGGGEFERSYKKVNTPEPGNTGESLLDLFINKFSINFFDKRDVFPFSIVRISLLTSNIPSKIFYTRKKLL